MFCVIEGFAVRMYSLLFDLPVAVLCALREARDAEPLPKKIA
jgi:hypothetical protein